MTLFSDYASVLDLPDDAVQAITEADEAQAIYNEASARFVRAQQAHQQAMHALRGMPPGRSREMQSARAAKCEAEASEAERAHLTAERDWRVAHADACELLQPYIADHAQHVVDEIARKREEIAILSSFQHMTGLNVMAARKRADAAVQAYNQKIGTL